jgi:hypothetical protein
VVIAKVETLFMIVHQNPYVPASPFISFGMEKRIVYEQKQRKMNWARYAKWTYVEQQRCKSCASNASANTNSLFSNDEVANSEFDDLKHEDFRAQVVAQGGGEYCKPKSCLNFLWISLLLATTF